MPCEVAVEVQDDVDRLTDELGHAGSPRSTMPARELDRQRRRRGRDARAAPAPRPRRGRGASPRATSRASGTIPQLVHGVQALGGRRGEACADDRGDLLGRLDGVGGHVDGAEQDVLVAEELDQRERARASSRTPARRRRCGSPRAAGTSARTGATRRRASLPVDVGLDAVAVADVHDGAAREAGDRASRASMPQSRTSSM